MAGLDQAHFSRQRYDGMDFFNRRVQQFNIGDQSHKESARRVNEFTDVFEEDIGRVIYSSAFRRLQNKTQVHPRPSSDFVRNRLTHTIEVSYVGKLIANAIGKYLYQSEQLPTDINTIDIVNIVVASSLAHDIGNPPFGHTGEDAIRSWFENNSKKVLSGR